MTNQLGTCPKCNGTKQLPIPENEKHYSWNKGKEFQDCNNCGGQYQFGKPSGQVKLDKEGNPCLHSYRSSAGRWRCTVVYRCEKCEDSYMIDSGD